MDAIIKVQNLVKSFQSTKKIKINVLKKINLEIQKSKINIIIGSSGAGKSTLLHLLSGLDRPDSGIVFFKDENIFSFSDDKLAKFRNKNIGFIFQFHHLLPEFTALENTAIPLLINNISMKKSFARSEELLNLVGLKDRMNHKPAELSGGEQQRVAIARALANDPEIIFADEPTGNLDTENSQIINQILVDLRDKLDKTFVIATHNSDLVKLGDITFEIKDGNILK